MNTRISTIEVFVDVVKLLVQSKEPMSAKAVVGLTDVGEPSVRRYLDMLESRGLIRPADPATPSESRARRGIHYEWVR